MEKSSKKFRNCCIVYKKKALIEFFIIITNSQLSYCYNVDRFIRIGKKGTGCREAGLSSGQYRLDIWQNRFRNRFRRHDFQQQIKIAEVCFIFF